MYSVSDEYLCYFCCRRSGEQKGGQSAFVLMGFRAWWKLNPKVSQHENSPSHVTAFQRWKVVEIRSGNSSAFDALHQQQQLKDEAKKWI